MAGKRPGSPRGPGLFLFRVNPTAPGCDWNRSTAVYRVNRVRFPVGALIPEVTPMNSLPIESEPEDLFDGIASF